MRLAITCVCGIAMGLLTLTVSAQDAVPVLVLSFDDGAGNTARDSSGNGFDGKLDGPIWVAGAHGGGLEFDGVDDFVQVADEPDLLLLEGGTLMAWAFIKTDAGHADWPRVMIKANTTGGSHGYDLLFDRGAGYSVRFCIGGACGSHFVMETDPWHHVAVAFDGETITVFVDGEQVAEGPQPGPAIDTTGEVLTIGNAASGPRHYKGIYDEIRVFDVPLTEDAVAWHMERGDLEVFAVSPKGKAASTWGDLKRR